MSLDGKVARNSAIMAGGTIISRFTGIGRDIAMTAALGLGVMSDAYSLGNTLPNMMYTLLIGGALQAVFVPQLVRHMKDDADGGVSFADRLLTLSGVLLLGITLVCVLAAPWLTKLYATNDYSPQELQIATQFAYLCLPQIFFYGIFTMLSQVLYARESFGAPMFAPIANNLVSIAVFALYIWQWGASAASGEPLTTAQVLLTGVGTTLGVAVQAVVLFPIAKRAGYGFRPRFDWRGFGLGKSASLGKWTIGVVLLNQTSLLVVTKLATTANVLATEAGEAAGGLTTLQKAHLIFVLPHSLITVSLVTAMLPGMSRLAHDGKLREIGDSVGSAMRAISALVIPIGALMTPLSVLIASVLFGYGAAAQGATAADPEFNSNTLLGVTVTFYMIGLIPYTLYYVLIRGWYSMEDTKSVFIQGILLNAITIAFALALFNAVPRVQSLALAYALSYWITFLIAWRSLAKRLGHLDVRRTAWVLCRMLVAGLFAGLTCYEIAGLFDALNSSKVEQLVTIVVASAAGSVVYLVLAWLLRIDEVSDVLRMLRRKLIRR